MKQIQGKIC